MTEPNPVHDLKVSVDLACLVVQVTHMQVIPRASHFLVRKVSLYEQEQKVNMLKDDERRRYERLLGEVADSGYTMKSEYLVAIHLDRLNCRPLN